MIQTFAHEAEAPATESLITGRTLAAVWAFTVALLRAGLKNRTALMGTLFTPLFMVGLFALITPKAKPGEFDMLSFIFPGIVGFTVMLAGGSQVTRLGQWRAQGVFGRLACTPVPLGVLMLGASLAGVLLGLVQAIVVMAAGMLLFGLSVSPLGVVGAVGVLTLGGACFIAYGSLVATLVRRLEVANLVFMFTLLPMGFLGNTFLPVSQLPSIVQTIGPWLPTALVADLTRSLITSTPMTHDPLWQVAGLLAYTAAFSALSAWWFRAEA
jgi:ABC-2 type transport system permease protein